MIFTVMLTRRLFNLRVMSARIRQRSQLLVFLFHLCRGGLRVVVGKT